MSINRAEIKHQIEFNALQGKCVFISYKAEDKEVAKAIGEYLLTKIEVDIYLDLYDVVLKEAVSEENDKKIVESIQKGLSTSTHILCIVSDKTRLSWWVPYELGYASAKGKVIASLQLKSVDDIPSFLKTEKVLKSVDDFFEYVKGYNIYAEILLPKDISYEDKSILGEFIKY